MKEHTIVVRMQGREVVEVLCNGRTVKQMPVSYMTRDERSWPLPGKLMLTHLEG